jgi:AcrR family transcriptional regulator
VPKIVDHARRRDEIAHIACQVVAMYGFEQATVARIARAAGYTTGMVAHYFDSKQDIILAALRLILMRIEERLTRERGKEPSSLLSVLSEALAIDAARFTECAFWMAFWGQVSADPKLKRLNAWVHREYMRLFARCFEEHWTEWRAWPDTVRDQVLRLVVACINGITAGAVTSPRDWPAGTQTEQLRLQLELLRAWGRARSGQRRTGLQPRARRRPPTGDGDGLLTQRRTAAHHQDHARLRSTGAVSPREGSRGNRRAAR